MKFNKTDLLYTHVDNRILGFIKEGQGLDDIIESLKFSCEKFAKVLEQSQPIGNCMPKDSRTKYVFTHNEVAKKRIKDMEYLIELTLNYEEFSKYSVRKLFNLLKFRDKISDNKIVVELDV